MTVQLRRARTTASWRWVLPLIVLLAALYAVSGCAASAVRDFRSPGERVVGPTAFILDGYDTEVTAGLVGLDLPETGMNLGIRQGLGGVADLRLNIGHATFGILSAGAAARLYETPRFSLGLDVALLVARPRNVWVLPEDVRTELEDVTLSVLPVRLATTVTVTDWLMLTLRAGYDGALIEGALEAESDFLNAGAGARQLYFEPHAHVAVGASTVLFAYGRFPYWARGRVDATVLTELEPGVRAGVTTVDWASIPRGDLVGYGAGAEWWWDNGLSVQFALSRNLLTRTVIDLPLLPALRLNLRF